MVSASNMSEKRGIKRKLEEESSTREGVSSLATSIIHELQTRIPDDPILECGPAYMTILQSRPQIVLDLARQKLHAWPYKNVSPCWRRLYEESSLWSTVRLLQANANPRHGEDGESPACLTGVVMLLDSAIQMTGTPGRSRIFETIFMKLEALTTAESTSDWPAQFAISTPNELQTNWPVPRRANPPSFEEFQSHLDGNNIPIIVEGAVEHWPARKNWTSPSYWMKRTLGGRRMVQVEIGSQYTDDSWSQRILSFENFLSIYMMGKSTEIGYLAQYDLFSQIPALRSDVQVPDYCYCSPPRSMSKEADQRDVLARDIDDPLMNLWLGPAGTKTPLHTDPYSNILVQVMGYKYFRLYAAAETPKLYTLGVHENGVDMSNTSSIDVSLARSHHSVEPTDLAKGDEQNDKYPLFAKADFVEGILGPGDCLYIPQGWWHYVEGLTLGASVSFWWN